MLQRIGDALKGVEGSAKRRWITYLLVGTLSIVFAAWGAYGIVNLSFGGSNYAAEAAGSKITLEQARNAWLREQAQWQQRFGGADIPAELRSRLQDQVLEGMISRALIAQRTHDLGYRVGHDELIEAIKSEPAFQIDGQYSAAAANDALARAGYTGEAFQEQLRKDLQRAQLENALRGSDFLTPTEFARLRELEDQEREVRYAILPVSKFPAAPADDAAIEAYYKAHEKQYLTPEFVHVQYGELKLDALEAQTTVSDADLKAQYDKQKSQLMTPEKRRAQHILITGQDDAAALKEAQDVLAQAKAGRDFGELAKQYSKDPGSASNGGELGWADKTTFVAPFADALFGMQPGEIRGPVKTQFGYHIIRLEEIQAGKGKSFDDARPQLEAELKRNHATDRFGEIQEQLQTKLSEPSVDLNAVAQEFKLETGDIAEYVKGAGAAPLGAPPPLQELLFGEPPLAAGHLGGPVLLGDNALVVVKVLEHRKPAPKPLAEVRADIVSALARERGTQAALKAAEAAQARLTAGTSFDAVVQSLGVTAEGPHFVGRNDPSVPAPIRAAAFAAPRPARAAVYRALTMADGGAAVIAVTAVRTGAEAADPQSQADRMLQEAGREGVGDVMAYVGEVRRTADVKKNPKAFD
ncbi:MAG TPA: peptidyl-prolyl cis-trans isomerase [Steroidobacteraceae bacterium]|nr:peptidyl-prolyl cis-trans isomerase [Steroidobacteraceae bacterium]